MGSLGGTGGAMEGSPLWGIVVVGAGTGGGHRAGMEQSQELRGH